jgi:hypothetical protein
MGGDVLAGTNFVDGLRIFEDDPDTEGIILVGEIGGTAELDAAEWIRGYRARVRDPKYVVLFSSLVVSLILVEGLMGWFADVCVCAGLLWRLLVGVRLLLVALWAMLGLGLHLVNLMLRPSIVRLSVLARLWLIIPRSLVLG